MDSPKAPLSVRLAALVTAQIGGAATLNCEFRPGGKLHGVGIRGPLWCENCGGAQMWHTVAEAAAFIAAIEEGTRRARAAEEEGQSNASSA